MTGNTYVKLIDVTWVLLLLATLLLWTSFEEGSGANALRLMAIMIAKSSLIAFVFMDLWRRSKVALFWLLVTMVATGLAILMLAVAT